MYSRSTIVTVGEHPGSPILWWLRCLYRWLTLNEVKKLHGIPEDYYLGTSKTGAGEVIGQAVIESVTA